MTSVQSSSRSCALAGCGDVLVADLDEHGHQARPAHEARDQGEVGALLVGHEHVVAKGLQAPVDAGLGVVAEVDGALVPVADVPQAQLHLVLELELLERRVDDLGILGKRLGIRREVALPRELAAVAEDEDHTGLVRALLEAGGERADVGLLVVQLAVHRVAQLQVDGRLQQQRLNLLLLVGLVLLGGLGHLDAENVLGRPEHGRTARQRQADPPALLQLD